MEFLRFLFTYRMNRRVACAALLCAWLCASGAMLDVAQVIAWTRMFANYARTESLSAATSETFDLAKPCTMCRAITKAREASESRSPAAPAPSAEKIILICENSSDFVPSKVEAVWPDIEPGVAAALCGEVPVPPPRGPATIHVA